MGVLLTKTYPLIRRPCSRRTRYARGPSFLFSQSHGKSAQCHDPVPDLGGECGLVDAQCVDRLRRECIFDQIAPGRVTVFYVWFLGPWLGLASYISSAPSP
jgi:hypothetical protein